MLWLCVLPLHFYSGADHGTRLKISFLPVMLNGFTETASNLVPYQLRKKGDFSEREEHLKCVGLFFCSNHVCASLCRAALLPMVVYCPCSDSIVQYCSM